MITAVDLGHLELLARRFVERELDGDAYVQSLQDVLSSVGSGEPLGRSADRPAPGPSGGPGGGTRTTPTARTALELHPGTVLCGRFTIGRQLGRGGFGAVFAAEDRLLGEELAIKMLDPVLLQRREALESFRREVVLLRRLTHPRVVRVFEYHEDSEALQIWFGMELVRGSSVRELIDRARDRGEPVEPPLCLRIVEQVAEALAEAHAQGISHGDVTPSNILLAGHRADELLTEAPPAPQVKLVDFGVGKLVGREALAERSRAQGTAPYMAPEVLGSEPRPAELLPAADLYGVGAVAYEMLTGRRAVSHFDRSGRADPALPSEVRSLLSRLLRREAVGRPEACQVLVECRRIAERLRRQCPERGPGEDPRRLRGRLDRAMESGDATRVRDTLERLKSALGPFAENDAEIGVAEAWLLDL